MSFLSWFNSMPFGAFVRRIGADEKSRLSAAYSAAESKCIREYSAVINYAIEKAGGKRDIFLCLWRDGATAQLKQEFPDFEAANDVPDLSAPIKSWSIK